MFFWFSFGSYVSRFGTTTMRCPRCGTETPHDLRETGQKFSLFFIPLAKFGRRYFLTCERCGMGQEIPESSARSIRSGETLPSKNPFDLR